MRLLNVLNLRTIGVCERERKREKIKLQVPGHNTTNQLHTIFLFSVQFFPHLKVLNQLQNQLKARPFKTKTCIDPCYEKHQAFVVNPGDPHFTVKIAILVLSHLKDKFIKILRQMFTFRKDQVFLYLSPKREITKLG